MTRDVLVLFSAITAFALSSHASEEVADVARQRQAIAVACHGGSAFRLEINGAWREFKCVPRE